MELPPIPAIPDTLKGEGEVIVASWGGAVLDAQLISTIEPFQELTGISVVVAESPDPSKIKAMVDTGNVEWDVVWLGLGDILALDGYWEAMDYSYFDTENIAPEFIGEHSIASVLFAEILAYRTDAFESGTGGLGRLLECRDVPWWPRHASRRATPLRRGGGDRRPACRRTRSTRSIWTWHSSRSTRSSRTS